MQLEHLPSDSDQLQEFFSIARNAGQDLDKIREGALQLTYFRIENMHDAKKILSRATPEDRIKRSETFLDGLEYRSRIAQGMHDRGEAFVFANHPLETEKDSVGLRNHFPVHVRSLSILEKTVEAGQVWDITEYPSEWGVDDKEEMYNIVNVGKLTLKKNASIVVHGNALIFTCQELIKESPSSNEYDFGILGTKHGFGMRKGAFDGLHGKDGKEGQNGENGIDAPFRYSFLGKELPNDFQSESMDGHRGQNGESGENGQDGLNGGACRVAEINIRSLKTSTPFVFGVIPGNGGIGGNGGRGGHGGCGGNGADAIKAFNGLANPGKAGVGGVGGNGGKGGRAGHSGLSSNIFVNVPQASLHDIQCFSKYGKPGIPGKGGSAGCGGTGGNPGNDLNGDKAFDTLLYLDGLPGRDGKEGKTMPKAKIYVNNEVLILG